MGDAMQYEGQDNCQTPYSTTESEAGKNASPFSCNVCKRNYSRVDHLARHYRSHTREKPFTCTTCNKSFARADLLKRHSISHNDKTGTKRQHNSSHLARVAQACLSCAGSKLKCGGEKPCQRCRQKNITCTFPPSNEKAKNLAKSQVPEVKKSQEDLDMDGLEGAQTLATLDSHNRMLDCDPQTRSPFTTDASSVAFSQHTGMTPSDAMHDSHHEVSSTPLVDNALLGIDESSLAEFLRDVMMPITPDSLAGQQGMDFLPQHYTGRDVFNFGMDSSLDMNDGDFGWINSQNCLRQQQSAWNPHIEVEHPVDRGQRAPDVSSGMTAGAEAFQKSVWQWKPNQTEHANAEQANLAISHKDMQWQYLEARLAPDILDQRIEYNSRDKILAMLLSTCEPGNVPRVVSSFPSAELLDSLMHLFFRSDLHSTDAFIHLPTFRPQYQMPELNGIVVAAGAVLSNVPTVRRLGFAIQESVRAALIKICESDNSKTRDLQLVQTFALELSIGLWSGNKRKMEIAESNSQPLITMLRRSGYLGRRVPATPPEAGDDDKTLDHKWRAWVEAESFKRVAFHTLIHDAQASISLLTRPLISYAELSLELPYTLALWRAKNAHAWRDIYLSLPGISTRLPSLMHCHFRMTVPGGMSQEAVVLQELYLMNLHVSFEELQLFAGKEGNEEAQRVYPLLKQWFGNRKSREAIFHAGQVLRAANSFPSSQLRDFYAVALYHVALCVWVYGMCSLGTTGRSNQPLGLEHDEIIWLDGEETASSRRFIANARGIPMIQGREPNSACRLDNPKAMMESIIGVMGRSCTSGHQGVPPLVENLSQLMRDLGNAFEVIGKYRRG
ncbi:Early growth response protein 1-B [Lachnellula willkommii]|uniref:Early growth response protein 1-B n=1 Tax=Lachnellula willkommii TaxID=215461 RepID=A0A559M1X4_9HELO|nr:Early growth response protein 1-B [Lachnellula willkommii]